MPSTRPAAPATPEMESESAAGVGDDASYTSPRRLGSVAQAKASKRPRMMAG